MPYKLVKFYEVYLFQTEWRKGEQQNKSVWPSQLVNKNEDPN